VPTVLEALRAENAKLRAALRVGISALQSLPEDALGEDWSPNGSWPIRGQILSEWAALLDEVKEEE
jgi:hypothetical protein